LYFSSSAALYAAATASGSARGFGGPGSTRSNFLVPGSTNHETPPVSV
jgi:hypothetical protein